MNIRITVISEDIAQVNTAGYINNTGIHTINNSVNGMTLSPAIIQAFAIILENSANLSCDVLMYVRKAALLHQPSLRIVKSSRPTFAAAVAAPILTLCPAKFMHGTPILRRASLIDEENFALVRGVSSLNLKKGPGSGPLLTMYISVADTGHNSPPVFPIYMCAPFPAWSVLTFSSRSAGFEERMHYLSSHHPKPDLWLD